MIKDKLTTEEILMFREKMTEKAKFSFNGKTVDIETLPFEELKNINSPLQVGVMLELIKKKIYLYNVFSYQEHKEIQSLPLTKFLDLITFELKKA